MEQAKSKFINLQKKQKETERMATITGQNLKRSVLSGCLVGIEVMTNLVCLV